MNWDTYWLCYAICLPCLYIYYYNFDRSHSRSFDGDDIQAMCVCAVIALLNPFVIPGGIIAITAHVIIPWIKNIIKNNKRKGKYE